MSIRSEGARESQGFSVLVSSCTGDVPLSSPKVWNQKHLAPARPKKRYAARVPSAHAGSRPERARSPRVLGTLSQKRLVAFPHAGQCGSEHKPPQSGPTLAKFPLRAPLRRVLDTRGGLHGNRERLKGRRAQSGSYEVGSFGSAFDDNNRCLNPTAAGCGLPAATCGLECRTTA